MGSTEEQADRLAKATVEAMERLGDDRLHLDIAKAIGTASPTTEEAYLTAVRVRLAIARGEAALAKRLAEAAPETEA